MEPGPSLERDGPRASSPLDIAGPLLVRNTLLNLAGQGVPLVVVLLTVPYLIARLGDDRFGILAVSWVVMNGAATFDFGLGRALRKLVAEALGAADRARVARLAHSALIAQLVSGLLGGALLLLATPLLAGRVLQVPIELQGEARQTFALLAVAIPMVVVMEGLFGLLEAAQRFDLVNGIKVPFYLSSALVPVIGVALGLALPSIVLLLIAAVATILLVQLGLGARVFPELRRWPRAHRPELRELFGFGGWIMVSNAVNPLLTYVERLAVGALIAIGAVTQYTAPSELVMRLSMLAACLADTLFPAFSTLGGQGRMDVLRVFASRAVKYLLLLLAPLVILVIAYGRDLLRAWLGEAFTDDSVLVLQILAVGVLANSLASVPYSLLHARGRPDVTAKFHLIELAIHAVVVWALVSAWGIPGAALAWTIRVSLDAVLLFVASAKLDILPIESVLEGRAWRGALGLAIALCIGTVTPLLSPPAWAYVLVPLLAAAGAVFVTWSYLLDDHDRDNVTIAFRTGAKPR
ncbi:MAG: oligosaccharide flippase family protein [Deltaproteobacteria bacterium]|nr:oligosaccharide flippase family protein [Deltaproteobacteria bacterium]